MHMRLMHDPGGPLRRVRCLCNRGVCVQYTHKSNMKTEKVVDKRKKREKRIMSVLSRLLLLLRLGGSVGVETRKAKTKKNKKPLYKGDWLTIKKQNSTNKLITHLHFLFPSSFGPMIIFSPYHFDASTY